MDGPCQECWKKYTPWFTAHHVWNGVLNGDLDDHSEAGGMLCIDCFLIRADYLMRVPAWHLVIEQLEITAPSK